jgi:hypothetical protein
MDGLSYYYVTSSKYNAEYDVYEYNVQSENGFTYIFAVDLNKSLFKVLSKEEDGVYLLVYNIRKYWK